MRGLSRRGALTVKDGRVQKKNNWELSPNYYSHPQRELVIDRRRPGAGYRHVLMQRDVEEFIALLPDWEEMSQDLDAIVLAPGHRDRWGYHSPGVVHLCAWPQEIELSYFPAPKFDRPLLDKLRVHFENLGDETVALFTLDTARAFMLLDVFLHEIGHHHDAITNRSKRVARGEPYAEAYALKYGDLVWERFTRHFPLG